VKEGFFLTAETTLTRWNYAAKHWTALERNAAQARAFSENQEYILPIRLDYSEIPGILSTTSYLDWNKEGLEAIITHILAKLNK